METELNYIY